MNSCTMKLHVRFTRDIDKNMDYLSPGGFEMIMNGKQVQFDFVRSYGDISEKNHNVCIFRLVEPDIDAFPKFKDVTPEDIKNISEIVECFVYTGEDDESDLDVKAIERILFFLPDEDESLFEVPKEIIDRFNTKSRIEMSGMNWGRHNE